MPAYEYEALDPSGRARRGIVSADSPHQARRELRRLRLTPLRLSAPRAERAGRLGGRRPPRLGHGAIVLVTRQLAALVAAATPLEEALNAVALQTEKPAARARLLAVRERVMEGWRFADALAEDPRSFSDLYRAVVAAGETSGDLAGALDRLATMLEKNRAMRNKALAALVYPAVLALVAGGVLTLLMTTVVPKIVEQFNAFGGELPAITRVVMGLSHFIGAYGLYLLVGVILLLAAFWRGMKTPAFKLAVDRALLRLPVIGRLLRGLDGARFARTLSTLVAGGAPLLDSLAGAQRTCANDYIRARLDGAIAMVREGASLANALRRAGALPPMMTHMAAAGERSGALPDLLDRAAAQLEDEFDAASTVALRLLEPAIIFAMGGAIMVIVISILLPILRLNALAAG
ncbi:type II secretion system inner membrane protein GspF [Amphiplicatus metriothermophilus]|uniref:General secretion pathway protein F n=1 Tax=Amphiplicatus metriothermophilus TaxID=1519374 RepID=A0A239PQ96_9PROT|nr:type II secretion system inner membrane protein GspF [Amphiplicatus metriothermophilus]MBB5518759.1 general secretion pathway protein F [Amphiplicatus metriothermophilus]SNT72086.1 type II secretion system protein F (GspF) [Amphiplicatus metriothermophilus]